MCQHARGESDYLVARDENTRRRGYKAQQQGIPREQCPEREHSNPEYSLARQWRMGWDTAAEGRECW